MKNTKKPNIALLTIGAGPVSKKTFELTLELFNLKAVVISKKKKSALSFFTKIRIYGLWYVYQHIVNITLGKLFFDKIEIKTRNIPTLEWNEGSDQIDIARTLKSLGTDFVLVCGFQYILEKDFLNKFDFCVNLHQSYLPRFRGPEPITWTLLDKASKEAGITLHLIDENIDTGDILYQAKTNIPFLKLLYCTERRISGLVPEILKSLHKGICEDSLTPKPQEAATYFPRPTLAARREKKLQAKNGQNIPPKI